MTSILQGSSEIAEAARLVRELLAGGKGAVQSAPPAAEPAPSVAATPPIPPPQVVTPPVVAAPSSVAAADPAPLPEGQPVYREDRLQGVLETMCRRGGFSGALITDSKGFPLASHGAAANSDAIAAFSSVLGETLRKAGTFLGHQGADCISIDLDYSEKLSLHRFALGNAPYYLMILCPQDTDERSEVAVSLEQVAAILS